MDDRIEREVVEVSEVAHERAQARKVPRSTLILGELRLLLLLLLLGGTGSGK